MNRQPFFLMIFASILLGMGVIESDCLAFPDELNLDKPLPNLRTFSRQLFGYHDGKAWGYMDRSGMSVIPPSFLRGEDFFDDFAVVRKNDTYGFLNTAGKLLALSKEYNRVFRVSNSRARVSKEQGTLTKLAGHFERFTFIDVEGNQITKTWYDFAGDFSEGLAKVNIGASRFSGYIRGGRWGYIDPSGKEVIDLQFDDAGDFYEGLAKVRKGSKWGFIDRHGKLQIDAQFDHTGDFSEGLATVVINRKYSYIDKNGVTKIPGPYALAYRFSEGRAVVTNTVGPEGEMFYIDHDGKVAISLGLDTAVDFSEGLACASKGPQWGFIDINGNWAIEPQFDSRADFIGGLAMVTTNRYYRYIDKKNKPVRKRLE